MALFPCPGCIPPLLHLLAHKRCAVSQLASCVLSALAEGGMSRDKLCQDTALLAMMRCLQANHCATVTLGEAMAAPDLTLIHETPHTLGATARGYLPFVC